MRNLGLLGVEETWHPLAYLVYQTENQIQKSLQNRILDIDEAALRTAYLGERIKILEDKKVEGLKEKILELRSPKKDLFEKTYFEIQVAAAYAERGNNIQFVKTTPQEGKRTYDLLVDDIEVECTKKDRKTDRDRENIDKWNNVARAAVSLMEYVGLNYFVHIVTRSDPTDQDVEHIKNEMQKLLKSKKEGEFHYDNGTTIKLQIVSWKDQKVPVSGLPQVVLDEYDHLVMNMKLDSENIFTANFCENPRVLGFDSGTMNDRIGKIVNSVKKKRGQFSGTRPAILYVHMNGLEKRASSDDLLNLDESLREELARNTSITATVLAAEYYERKGNILDYQHRVRVTKNITPKNPLPTGFSIVGDYS
ncbi:hypothetical protein [Nitrososphaera viennensis]|uniref:Uncharacterized protein n=2 Tax=Nitrososphaera viennensis TaxID=1034015 RepID=A0A060HJX3_9ARCH|nr:hypothetical protein [Nitrososphaera viennensis]AIC16834.1 hypothetical protein NVIE_025640 [Nitrososphaera viennensis EN76]UVS68740.1 hypothetical protein NWT39_12640 [Nitrososphaera viennensis]